MDYFEIPNILSKLLFIFFLLIFILYAIRILRGKYAKPKKVKATVINKQTYIHQPISKYDFFARRKYIVTFLCGDEKIFFDVSADTYELLKLKQKGTLTYKGSQFWNFE